MRQLKHPHYHHTHLWRCHEVTTPSLSFTNIDFRHRHSFLHHTLFFQPRLKTTPQLRHSVSCGLPYFHSFTRVGGLFSSCHSFPRAVGNSSSCTFFTQDATPSLSSCHSFSLELSLFISLIELSLLSSSCHFFTSSLIHLKSRHA